ncbi:hypothetical protein M758_1G065400 [Ceratodon purpureus]|uniref:Uncharacterized protein n=1 Tax=Ceratodon purpureus TaxID=3225 RepID=A0A8T0J3A5_CERPU|nr:hypothetical protein KC19_1G067200 [Ceratodon purpureus]KAG0628949.1 hypothetical protein M758_1G065400 [Ceratodon purpureus]
MRRSSTIPMDTQKIQTKSYLTDSGNPKQNWPNHINTSIPHASRTYITHSRTNTPLKRMHPLNQAITIFISQITQQNSQEHVSQNAHKFRNTNIPTKQYKHIPIQEGKANRKNQPASS